MDSFGQSGFMQAVSNHKALWVGGIVGVVLVVVLVVVLLVSMNKNGSGEHTAPNRAPSSAPAAGSGGGQHTVPNRGGQHTAPNNAAARLSPVRAAVLGSTPHGLAGAPYRTATETHTFGIPFPAASGRPESKDSIWADPLPTQSDASYKGARARQSADGLGGNYQLTGGRDLFNRQPDELDAKDIDVARDAFPAADTDKPKNGHEAIAQMYNYANFRAAMDRNGPAGYLAPVFDRQGWSKLGDRDPCLWKEQMSALRDEFPKNMSLAELMDAQMVPLPDQFADFWYQAAEQRGVKGIQYDDIEGMGAPAASQLWGALDREWAEGKGAKRLGGGEAAQMTREATQAISTQDASAALRAMQEITGARQQASADGLRLPPPSAQQLQAVRAWAASSNGPVRAAAQALLNSRA